MPETCWSLTRNHDNMQKSKLGLDFEKVEYARGLAKGIAEDVQSFVEQYTTVAVERTLCRLMGIDGVDDNDVPLPNVVVEALKDKGVLNEGALFFIANAMIQTGLNPQQIAEKVAADELDITKVVTRDPQQIAKALQPVIDESMTRIRTRRSRREHYLETIGEGPKPYLYIIVATGNIYEDVVQAQAGARQGADVIAVIRTTGQSLLDYVPYGASASCVRRSMKWARSRAVTSACVTIAQVCVCPRSPSWALSRVWT